MGKTKITVTRTGIGFVGALQIVFIVLKLIGKISWKWLWVLAPSWIYIGWTLLLLIIGLIIIACSE